MGWTWEEVLNVPTRVIKEVIPELIREWNKAPG